MPFRCLNSGLGYGRVDTNSYCNVYRVRWAGSLPRRSKHSLKQLAFTGTKCTESGRRLRISAKAKICSDGTGGGEREPNGRVDKVREGHHVEGD